MSRGFDEMKIRYPADFGPMRKRILRFWGGAALAIMAAGCGGLEPAGQFTPLAVEKISARPARLKIYPPLAQTRITDQVAVVIVNLEGQNLRLFSQHLLDAKTETGTIGAFLPRLNEPYKFDLLEVSAKNGEILGYLLLHADWIDSFYLQDDGSVFIRGRSDRTGGGQ